MNSIQPLEHPAAARGFARGVPFSTRLDCHPGVGLAPVNLSNRAFVRAWMARRAAKIVLPVRPLR